MKMRKLFASLMAVSVIFMACPVSVHASAPADPNSKIDTSEGFVLITSSGEVREVKPVTDESEIEKISSMIEAQKNSLQPTPMLSVKGLYFFYYDTVVEIAKDINYLDANVRVQYVEYFSGTQAVHVWIHCAPSNQYYSAIMNKGDVLTGKINSNILNSVGYTVYGLGRGSDTTVATFSVND